MFFFKKPEYRKFNLTPRYWDPEKEAREQREKRIKAELGLQEDDDRYVPHIRGQFKNEFQRRQAERHNAGTARTIRLFMILILLLLGAFYVFVKNADGIMRFFGM